MSETGTVIVLQAEGGEIKTIPGMAEAIQRASKAASFTGKSGETMTLLAHGRHEAEQAGRYGRGQGGYLYTKGSRRAGRGNRRHGEGRQAEACNACWREGLPAGKETASQLAAHVALGAALRAYRFDHYRTTQKPDDKIVLEKLTLAVSNEAEAKTHLDKLHATLMGVSLTRDLVSEPPNVLYPEVMAARSTAALQPLGVTCETLGVPEMTKLGMGSLLGVGMGSVREPKLLVMQYNGARTSTPIAFVGKGITFDTGGISLKPGPGMEEMKFDMAGGGAVIGLMAALAGRKAKVNAVGVVAIAENMPDGNAIRPGDVLTSMSGQTIEVHNTDAEGRLVLADALWYTNDRFKPQFMIDLATLTGACMVALGEEIGGMMSNNDELAAKLLAAGTATGETLWRLPLTETFDKAIDSDIADMKNIAGNRYAGSSIGGQFLKRFVKDTPWAHLDIAGVAWTKKDKPTCPKGATAYGVRLLDRFVADNYETAA